MQTPVGPRGRQAGRQSTTLVFVFPIIDDVRRVLCGSKCSNSANGWPVEGLPAGVVVERARVVGVGADMRRLAFFPCCLGLSSRCVLFFCFRICVLDYILSLSNQWIVPYSSRIFIKGVWGLMKRLIHAFCE
jgi:hypothetical protein